MQTIKQVMGKCWVWRASKSDGQGTPTCAEGTFDLKFKWWERTSQHIMRRASKHKEILGRSGLVWSTGVHNLQDLMPDNLKGNRHNNSRNKVDNKCNVLESFWNHPRLPQYGENFLPWARFLVPKRLGTTGQQYKKHMLFLRLKSSVSVQKCFSITIKLGQPTSWSWRKF